MWYTMGGRMIGLRHVQARKSPKLVPWGIFYPLFCGAEDYAPDLLTARDLAVHAQVIAFMQRHTFPSSRRSRRSSGSRRAIFSANASI